MAYGVDVAVRARQDLNAIYAAIHAGESDHALIWFQGLSETLRSLAVLPYRGEVTRENPTQRHLLYGRRPHIYRIIYRVDEMFQTVRIIHIRHGARRPLTGS